MVEALQVLNAKGTRLSTAPMVPSLPLTVETRRRQGKLVLDAQFLSH